MQRKQSNRWALICEPDWAPAIRGVGIKTPANCRVHSRGSLLSALSNTDLWARLFGTWRQGAMERIIWKWRESTKHEEENRQKKRANGTRERRSGTGRFILPHAALVACGKWVSNDVFKKPVPFYGADVTPAASWPTSWGTRWKQEGEGLNLGLPFSLSPWEGGQPKAPPFPTPCTGYSTSPTMCQQFWPSRITVPCRRETQTVTIVC